MELQPIKITSLLCKMCHRTLDQPRLFLCGHSYCHSCVQKSPNCLTCLNHHISCFPVPDITLNGIIEVLKSGTAKKQDLYAHIRCPVCLKSQDMPITLNCGHSLCRFCCFFVKHKLGECPCCRIKLWRTRPNETLWNLMTELDGIQCSNPVSLT